MRHVGRINSWDLSIRALWINKIFVKLILTRIKQQYGSLPKFLKLWNFCDGYKRYYRNHLMRNFLKLGTSKYGIPIKML